MKAQWNEWAYAPWGWKVLPRGPHFTSLGSCFLVLELRCCPRVISGKAVSEVELQQCVHNSVYTWSRQAGRRLKGKPRLVEVTLENSLWRCHSGIRRGCFPLQCQSTPLFHLLHTQGKGWLAHEDKVTDHTRRWTHLISNRQLSTLQEEHENGYSRGRSISLPPISSPTHYHCVLVVVVQSFSRVWLFGTPCTAGFLVQVCSNSCHWVEWQAKPVSLLKKTISPTSTFKFVQVEAFYAASLAGTEWTHNPGLCARPLGTQTPASPSGQAACCSHFMSPAVLLQERVSNTAIPLCSPGALGWQRLPVTE